MWSNIRKLKGQYRNTSIPHLSFQNQHYTTPYDISEVLASTYSQISDNSNFDAAFITHELVAESHPIDFTPNPLHSAHADYNLPITENEVRKDISHSKTISAPGID